MSYTDNEIIKALKCCKKARIHSHCVDLKCPFVRKYGCNISQEGLRNKALDLIKRLKADYDNVYAMADEFKDKAELLEIEKSALQHTNDKQKAEIKKLENIERYADKTIETQKAENQDLFYKLSGVMLSVDKWLEGDELKQDEVNRAATMREKTLQITEQQQAEIERLQKYNESLKHCFQEACILNDRLAEYCEKDCKKFNGVTRAEAIKEFAEKFTEIFMRYAHLHHYAEQARIDEIETVDGIKIEMQSVWDVLTLRKNEMAEYEEMNRLQDNIETIARERLLTELEKDFRLLVNEMTDNNFTKIEHNSLCETETYEGRSRHKE